MFYLFYCLVKFTTLFPASLFAGGIFGYPRENGIERVVCIPQWEDDSLTIPGGRDNTSAPFTSPGLAEAHGNHLLIESSKTRVTEIY
jgi:hypothetical protein